MIALIYSLFGFAEETLSIFSDLFRQGLPKGIRLRRHRLCLWKPQAFVKAPAKLSNGKSFGFLV